VKPEILKYFINRNISLFWRIIWPFTIFLLFIITNLSAQNKPLQGCVVSQLTGEKISFASISWKKAGFGRVSDSAGRFILYPKYAQDTLIVSHVGYNTLNFPFDNALDYGQLILELSDKKTNEVVVNRKYNRGLFWWKKIIQHKAENDPDKYRNFSCEMYKKMEMDLTNITKNGFEKIKLLKPFQFVLDNMDSTSEQKSFLPVFMDETVSEFWRSNNPVEKKEEIEGFRTSGIKNEVVLHFMDGLNQFLDVYDNSLIFFGKEFVCPLSNDAESYYNFKAADTQYLNGQRFLHLFFSPKREGDNCFSGDCWIHFATWAISSINLHISSSANINYVNRLDIKQEFNRLNDSVWVFYKNQFIAEVSPLSKNKIAFTVRQTSIFQHVKTNVDNVPVIFVENWTNDEVNMNDSAKKRTTGYWDQNRPEQLSDNEQKVYKMMDTLHNMPVFIKYSNTVNFLIEGRKKMGKIEIGPWYKWISSNQLEKLRLRFDLATTEEFSKALRMHGYLAYGTGDKQFNGGIDVKYKFSGDRGYYLKTLYLHDLDNGGIRNGGVGVTMDNMFSQLIRKPGVPQKFYQVDEYHLGFGKEWINNLSVYGYITRGSYKTFAPLPPQKSISLNQKDIFNTELGINLRYAPGEKRVETFRKDYRYGSGNPVFEFDFARGIPGIFGSMYRYDKYFAQVSQLIRIPRWGNINYGVYGGKIIGDALPFMLLEVHPGNDIFYYSKQSFNLMNRFQYLSDQYAGFTIEHDFEKKLINMLPFLRKINVRQFWNLKAVWGDLSAANKKLNCIEYSVYPMQSLNGKPYIEIGTGLDNIFRYFRLDLVWRVSQNTPPMINHSESFQSHAARFGIFGSFHIQF
jgi:Family of unknown function (DUF5686)/CarboxypepD_reg-like domain